jgi:hypothetical protein
VSIPPIRSRRLELVALAGGRAVDEDDGRELVFELGVPESGG